LNRRQFLRTATGIGVAGSIFSVAPLPALALPGAKKVVVVTFGGGARDEETFMPDGQENIPHLLDELIPRATFFSQVINRGILGHYVATASLATGAYETFNNFAAVPPDNPTVFEYFRKDLKRPATDAWVVAPSNGFARIGQSGHRSYGQGLGAGVILPKRLLTAALASGGTRDYDHLLIDSYESPVVAHQLMRRLAPSLLWITLHDMDIAHSGAFSLYVDGIQRSDRLCSDIWKMIQSEPEYAGKTTLLILPDFGRDSDSEAGGNGFQHHRTGDARSRTTWLMALGPGIRENVIVDRPVESIDLVPTLGSLLGFSPRLSKGKPLAEIL